MIDFMESMGEEMEDVVLVFERPTFEDIQAADIDQVPTVQLRKAGEVPKRFKTSIDRIAQWFDEFQIDSIEIWIQAAVESGKALNLFVSAKGEGGIKVILKPKKATKTT
ncbi:MAG: hypothetical protein ACE5IJ_08245 [Thermoplasmata archaeon]